MIEVSLKSALANKLIPRAQFAGEHLMKQQPLFKKN
jgi:hypothetical protein